MLTRPRRHRTARAATDALRARFQCDADSPAPPPNGSRRDGRSALPQPFGQFPPAWDAGLRGMCVSEQRSLRVPPVLGFGKKGVPRRGVPPDATLLYDIELLGINGDNIPR